MSDIRIVKQDITTLQVDAIVNAANNSLLGGGGVDGAIHRMAGPELLDACRKIGGCITGDVKLTRGYNLPAKWVIHTVGPVWQGGIYGEPELLASCYQSVLTLAADKGMASIAFPAIATGAFGYPARKAARVAVREILNFQKDHDKPKEIILACFDSEMEAIYRSLLS
ncbi:O-acetyl-ADP-ribose deacetylase [Mariprofundus sp. KV]|uniref:O-acetyl-ADP-ribose deacetylase n=1 Tax=Mariprofundus sp. KV TaxID=2608715 RepID=UPI0015A1D25B|nr:O-acetyl-ADP-ribose deacetylase [Mariprofundus sp. KV]NWF36228.1 O-acetyl-ADP-ribose deacetylase [Mariprofundus sp. KV]